MPKVTRPDGPRAPRVLLEFMLMTRPLETLERWAGRYGDPFALDWGGPRQTVYCGDPRAIQAILTAGPEVFEPRRGDKVLRFLLGDHAVQYLYGPSHQRERRLLAPPLHGQRMREHLDAICRIAEEATRNWIPGQPFRVRAFTEEVTLRVISRVVLGRGDGPIDELRKRLRSVLAFASPRLNTIALTWLPRLDLGPLSPWGRLARHRSGLDRLIFEEIRRRRESETAEGDVLGMLISARDEAGQPMADQAVRDEVMSLLFAGHETTASALAWALHSIHQSPAVRERLLDELVTAGVPAESAVILELPYLSAVCQETLRVHPGIVAIPRVLRAPLEFMGYRFEAGTTVVPCMHLTHRREDLYPEPLLFRPERFLERQYSPFEYWPFGAGDRRCLGMAFAQFEMKLVLATVLSRWELSPARQGGLKPERRGVFTAPPPAMSLVAVRRRQG